MNKTAIKNFAIWARNKLIADIRYKAGLMGITAEGINNPLPQSTIETEFYDIGTAEPYAIKGEEIKQRKSLVSLMEQKIKETDYATAYKYVIESVAYTWFNRLIAIRFMEVNDYLPSHIRVLSSESGKMEPDLVTTPFDADLSFTEEEKQEIIRLKNSNDLDACFRLLFIKQCNALNEILPALFEKTKDYTELLLNVSAIDKDGVVYHLINDIPEDDFNIEKGGQVEIIGWLYQYYNTEPKNEAFAKKEKITKEEIPAVTQLFTPDWIVRYMVENSLGRIWVEGHPNDSLKSNWKYYLEEAEQEPEVQKELDEIHEEYAKLNPEDIHFIDPCMGSGHILVYAFEVLMQIYEAQGYSQRDAARSILENNLYGLDIDDRAYQMAYFAVMMKARQYNRRILSVETPCHVYSIQESNSINRGQLQYFGAGLSSIEKNNAMNQITGLLDAFKDAKEYGSILNVENYNWNLLRRFVAGIDLEGQMTLDAVGLPQTQEKIKLLIDIGETMAQKYSVVVTNPPYMGNGSMNAKLTSFTKKNYPDSKIDLFAIFIEKCISLAEKDKYIAMITQHSWMFLSKFSELRKKVQNTLIVNMAHLGARAFEDIVGEVVQTTSFILSKHSLKDYKGTYYRLVDENPVEKELDFLQRKNSYISSQENYENIPDTPISYHLSDAVYSVFKKNSYLKDFGSARQGLGTSDNATFLRAWYEVEWDNIGFGLKCCEDTIDRDEKWFPYIKGGSFRRWYPNKEYVVNYKNDGADIKNAVMTKYSYLNSPDFVVKNTSTYFKAGITWSDVATGKFSARWVPDGYIYADAGPMFFANDKSI